MSQQDASEGRPNGSGSAPQPAPLGAVGTFLDAVAAGRPLPPVPEGLPPEMEAILEKLVETIGA